MATRSEEFRSAEQRTKWTGDKPERRASRGKPGTPPRERSRRKVHAGRKATHALEEARAGARPSRKSTRGSANRAKADTNFNLRESMQKTSPSARWRKTRARASRARGSR